MAIFNSYVKLPEGIFSIDFPLLAKRPGCSFAPALPQAFRQELISLKDEVGVPRLFHPLFFFEYPLVI